MKLVIVAAGLAAVTLTGLLPASAIAQDRPKEVKNLISAHRTLEMKIRPLQDRVRMASSTRAGGDTDAAGRVPERLRHKNRSMNDGADYSRIKVQLSALEKKAKRERERVMRPSFGVSGAQSDKQIADARKALNSLRRELTLLERQLNQL